MKNSRDGSHDGRTRKQNIFRPEQDSLSLVGNEKRTVVEPGQFLKDRKTMYERCTRLSDHFSESYIICIKIDSAMTIKSHR